MNVYKKIALLLLSFSLVACQAMQKHNTQHEPVKVRPFEVKQLGKSDVDIVIEIQIGYAMEHLKLLMEKLYRRNPREWRKGGHESLEYAVGAVFGDHRAVWFPELKGKRSIDAMYLAFDEKYEGDRVLALVEGLRGMIMDSYNGKQEIYLLDELDPQKIYYSARNIEITVWKLSNDRDSAGNLFLISNETGGEVTNLSFERIFGKLISLQDSSARIVAEGTNRRIKNVIQSVATAIFFPI